MPSIELSAGLIEYQDTGGDGPVLVLGHGVPMTAPTQWRKVLPMLSGFRCVLPTLPLGGHRVPMRPDADLSQHGVARILGEFVERFGLQDVCLVLNDWGGGQFLLSEGYPGAERVTRLVLVACEAFDNFPPRPARKLALAARVPGGIWLIVQVLRLRGFRRSSAGYGGMSVRGIPDEILAEWFRPARSNRQIRRDFAKFAVGAPPKAESVAAGERLRSFAGPALVVWAAQDRLMPAEHGPRLVNLLPRSRLVVIEDSATLIPEDQPGQLAQMLTEFVSTPTASDVPGQEKCLGQAGGG